MTKIYCGFITKFLSKKDHWGLALFCDEANKRLQLKIQGPISSMKPHTRYEISGQLVHHSKFGASLEVKGFKLATMQQESKAIRYLTSHNFPGVTKSQAELVFSDLGPNWVEKIQGNRQALQEIEHLRPELIPIIEAGIKRDYHQSPIEQKFRRDGLNLNIFQKLKEITLDDSEMETLLKNNFLAWTRHHKLGSVQDLDRVATSFGLEPTQPERVAFWLEDTTNKILLKTGNTYTDLDTLRNEIVRILGNISPQELQNGLFYAKRNQWLYFVNHKIYSAQSWTDEEIICHSLIKLKQNSKQTTVSSWRKLLQQVEKTISGLLNFPHFSFDKEQASCLKQSLRAPLVLVSGGPGTGKSTLILGFAILQHLLHPDYKINIATPTGRASMRLKTVIPDFNPVTLHRLLEFDENEFHRHQMNPLESNLVIIDEMSMVDNHLFAAFLRASKNLKQLILVGDVNQLPPVSYGDVFNDLISSKRFATHYLAKNHRQSEGNGIITLATAIQNNQLDTIDWRALPGVELIADEEKQNLLTLKLDYTRYYQAHNFDVMAYQIVAATYKGVTGIDLINQDFQSNFNENYNRPKKKYVHNENQIYAVNDKIICNRNFPEYDLANGEIGLIQGLDFKSEELIGGVADFAGKKVPLNKELFKNFSLCYACSIHKTQGSEYQKVALILNDHMAPNAFWNKKLIYTAITRAKQELLIMGTKETFVKIAAHEAAPRLSTIQEKLKKLSS